MFTEMLERNREIATPSSGAGWATGPFSKSEAKHDDQTENDEAGFAG